MLHHDPTESAVALQRPFAFASHFCGLIPRALAAGTKIRVRAQDRLFRRLQGGCEADPWVHVGVDSHVHYGQAGNQYGQNRVAYFSRSGSSSGFCLPARTKQLVTNTSQWTPPTLKPCTLSGL